MSSVRARFCFCLAIALILHALLLGWSSGSSQTHPDDARLLSATRSVGEAAVNAPDTSIRAAQNQQGDARASQRAQLANTPSQTPPNTRSHPPGERTLTRFVVVAEPEARPQAQTPDTPATPNAAIEIIRKPRPAQISAAARDARAAYLELWQERIEARGSRRYPAELLDAAQPRRLTMAVRVRADGSLLAVRVLRSSGNDALDNIALAIVRGAAPYPTFDEPLKEITSELSFAYDWLFEAGDSNEISRND
ncbi:TonB family protein [Salinisphaera sp.]|uniref:energy transducer TonB n=1 Tax=Salinisphaera sp. TaxID=1914330 RepID=UPI000C469582|nr:TonB family protein [Salinisphaera sp.]MBS61956.1 hypothetical protein [Salinisphaera sp.]